MLVVRHERGAKLGFGLEQVDRGVRHCDRVLLVEGERQLLQRLLELIGLQGELLTSPCALIWLSVLSAASRLQLSWFDRSTPIR
jgi:hypothetical protein